MDISKIVGTTGTGIGTTMTDCSYMTIIQGTVFCIRCISDTHSVSDVSDVSGETIATVKFVYHQMYQVYPLQRYM